LFRFDPVELVVYLDVAPEATSIDTIVPYTVRLFQRSGESLRYILRSSPVAKGLLSRCPTTPDSRGAHGR
jgi:hypothetical protein